jgi:hypothetical protein
LFTIIVGAILVLVALLFSLVPGPMQTFLLVLGVVSLLIALVAFMTTAERMRRETLTEGLAAKGPCLAFGVLMLAFGAIFAAIFIGVIASLSLMVALIAFAAALFFILAHSSLQVERLPIIGPISREPHPIEVGETPIETPSIGAGPPAGLGPALAYLDCKQGNDRSKSFPVAAYSVVIGRNDPTRWTGAPEDIVLTDKTVSRPHARVFTEGGVFYITDMNSGNGTYVQGNTVPPGERRQVQNGAQIRLGTRVILTFRQVSGGETELAGRRS